MGSVGNNGTSFWDFVKSGDSASSVSLSVCTQPKPKEMFLTMPHLRKKAKKMVRFDENTKETTNVLVDKYHLLASLAHLDDSQQSLIAQFVPKE